MILRNWVRIFLQYRPGFYGSNKHGMITNNRLKKYQQGPVADCLKKVFSGAPGSYGLLNVLAWASTTLKLLQFWGILLRVLTFGRSDLSTFAVHMLESPVFIS